MRDNALSRYSPRLVAPSPTVDLDEAAEEDTGFFGFLRGARDRALMLELRLKDGSMQAFSYALLDSASYDPSGTITLRFSGQEVRITGQRLNAPTGQGAKLFDAILRHRASWIREANRVEVLQANRSPVVEQIAVISAP